MMVKNVTYNDWVLMNESDIDMEKLDQIYLELENDSKQYIMGVDVSHKSFATVLEKDGEGYKYVKTVDLGKGVN